MKIGIVSNLYPPYVRGGAEHVVVRTVEALIEQDEDVFIITTCPKSRSAELECYKNAAERIYHFFPKNLYFILDDYKHIVPVRFLWHIIDAFSRVSAKYTEQIINKENPDVMITHNLKGIGLQIPKVIRKSGVPYVHVVHDLQLIYPSGLLYVGKEEKPFYLKPFYNAYQYVTKCLMGSPDFVIFPSEYLKGEYMSRGFFKKSKVEVIPNPAPDLEILDREGRLHGALKLLFVGQLEDHKGVNFLLDTFDKLDIDARLIFAGEGTLASLVEKRAEEDKRITYLGYIAIEQLVKCFGVANALVVPSLCYENSPTVIYEALQAGVPVLASDIGGVGELLENGVNGFLFEPGSQKDFIRAIHDLDKKKEAFTASQKCIRDTVAPHALPLYTRNLVKKLEKVIADK